MANNIRFVELYNRSGTPTFKDYGLREILRDDFQSSRLLTEGSLPEDLDPRQEFTNVSLNKGTYGQDIVVIGPISEVHQKLYSQRELLKG